MIFVLWSVGVFIIIIIMSIETIFVKNMTFDALNFSLFDGL